MRVDPKDAAFFYESRPGMSTDHYLFVGLSPASERSVVDELVDGLARIPRLRLALVPRGLDYPSWVTADVDARSLVTAAGSDLDWAGALEVFARIAEQPLDPTVSAVRVHVVDRVRDVPNTADPAGARPITVVVLQISHALTDGRGAIAIMRTVLGDDRAHADLPDVTPSKVRPAAVTVATAVARTPWLAGRFAGAAARSIPQNRRARRDIEAGVLPRRPAPRAPTVFNSTPGPDRALAVLFCSKEGLSTSGRPVTTVVLAAIAEAMANYLREHHLPVPDDLGAHVTVAIAADADWVGANRLSSASVGLDPNADPEQRLDAIVSALADERRRLAHPAVLSSVRAAETVPAPALRWGLRRLAAKPAAVHGHTTVTSVVGGPADLEFAGMRSLFVIGFPLLSENMCLDHGIWGLGDTLAVSILCSPSAFPDHDRYSELLSEALR